MADDVLAVGVAKTVKVFDVSANKEVCGRYMFMQFLFGNFFFSSFGRKIKIFKCKLSELFTDVLLELGYSCFFFWQASGSVF